MQPEDWIISAHEAILVAGEMSPDAGACCGMHNGTKFCLQLDT
jgi:hypothetical protein